MPAPPPPPPPPATPLRSIASPAPGPAAGLTSATQTNPNPPNPLSNLTMRPAQSVLLTHMGKKPALWEKRLNEMSEDDEFGWRLHCCTKDDPVMDQRSAEYTAARKAVLAAILQQVRDAHRAGLIRKLSAFELGAASARRRSTVLEDDSDGSAQITVPKAFLLLLHFDPDVERWPPPPSIPMTYGKLRYWLHHGVRSDTLLVKAKEALGPMFSAGGADSIDAAIDTMKAADAAMDARRNAQKAVDEERKAAWMAQRKAERKGEKAVKVAEEKARLAAAQHQQRTSAASVARAPVTTGATPIRAAAPMGAATVARNASNPFANRSFYPQYRVTLPPSRMALPAQRSVADHSSVTGSTPSPARPASTSYRAAETPASTPAPAPVQSQTQTQTKRESAAPAQAPPSYM